MVLCFHSFSFVLSVLTRQHSFSWNNDNNNLDKGSEMQDQMTYKNVIAEIHEAILALC